MRVTVATLVALAVLGGCKKDNDTGTRNDNERVGVDTAIRSQTTRDTTVIRSDTNIDVDTIKKTDHIKDRSH